MMTFEAALVFLRLVSSVGVLRDEMLCLHTMYYYHTLLLEISRGVSHEAGKIAHHTFAPSLFVIVIARLEGTVWRRIIRSWISRVRPRWCSLSCLLIVRYQGWF